MMTYYLFLVVVVVLNSTVSGQFFMRHKSRAELDKMPLSQLVEAYMQEAIYHHVPTDDSHFEYENLLKEYFLRDEEKVIPILIQIIDEYHPMKTNAIGIEQKRRMRCYVALDLLEYIDNSRVRLRVVAEGQKAMEAIRRALDRMRKAEFDQGGFAESQEQSLYHSTVRMSEEMGTCNETDTYIQNTLNFKYSLAISDAEMTEFVNYLIRKDPYYPSRRGKTELYQKELHGTLNGKGPKYRSLLKNPDPFYALYREFRAKK